MKKNNARKRITIVTVLYNSKDVIEKCLKSIPDGVAVYVVDNASTDNCAEVAKAARPSINLIKSHKNLGFGRGNNLALDKVTTEFALVLNPDTVMQQDTLDKLLTTADRYEDAAIITPTMFFENGTIQKTYKTSVFQREKSPLLLRKGLKLWTKNNRNKTSLQSLTRSRGTFIAPEGDLCADCLSGAAMLLRVKPFKKIGFFDPKIFLFYEDDDICLKTRKAGYSLVITPDSKLVHLMGKSSPVTYKNIYIKNWHMMWSRLYIEKKYKGNKAASDLSIKEIAKQSLKAIGHLLMLDSEKSVKSVARLAAIMAFICGTVAVKD